MKVGDLVRYKDWYGGHIGRCIQTQHFNWSGKTQYLFYWDLDGTEAIEEPELLEIIHESRNPMQSDQVQNP